MNCSFSSSLSQRIPSMYLAGPHARLMHLGRPLVCPPVPTPEEPPSYEAINMHADLDAEQLRQSISTLQGNMKDALTVIQQSQLLQDDLLQQNLVLRQALLQERAKCAQLEKEQAPLIESLGGAASSLGSKKFRWIALPSEVRKRPEPLAVVCRQTRQDTLRVRTCCSTVSICLRSLRCCRNLETFWRRYLTITACHTTSNWLAQFSKTKHGRLKGAIHFVCRGNLNLIVRYHVSFQLQSVPSDDPASPPRVLLKRYDLTS